MFPFLFFLGSLDQSNHNNSYNVTADTNSTLVFATRPSTIYKIYYYVLHTEVIFLETVGIFSFKMSWFCDLYVQFQSCCSWLSKSDKSLTLIDTPPFTRNLLSNYWELTATNQTLYNNKSWHLREPLIIILCPCTNLPWKMHHLDSSSLKMSIGDLTLKVPLLIPFNYIR